MARKGENIRHRKDGRWEGRYPAWDSKKEKQVTKSVYARTYTEVKEKLAVAKVAEQKKNITQEKTDTICTNNSSITFSALADNWLKSMAENHKHSTCVKYSQVYEKHLDPLFGKLFISDFRMANIEALLSRIEVRSKSLLNSIYSTVNQILKYAHNNYGTEYFRITAQDELKKNTPIEVFKHSEQSSLLKELRQGMREELFFYKLGILICLYTGLRIGEICALKWEDIDLVYGLLYVRRTVQRIRVDGQETKTMLVEGEPKSLTSKREIPLADDILDLLREISADNSRDKYIVSRNRPTEPRTMYNHYLKCLSNARIPQKTFHCLRHTFATNCINADVDPKSLSEILGHSDVTITLNRYVHPSIDTKRKHMNTLSSIMGQLEGQNKLEIA